MATTKARINSIWRRIERVLEARAPRTAATLAPPATDGQIRAVEQILGMSLPPDLADSLRVHNGQDDPRGLHSFCDYWLLLGTEQMVEMWRMCTEIDRQVREQNRHEPPPTAWVDAWWNATWIPFAEFNGDALCIDQSGSAPGNRGEVVRFAHDNAVERNIARDYTKWLEVAASQLEGGAFTVDDLGCVRFVKD